MGGPGQLQPLVRLFFLQDESAADRGLRCRAREERVDVKVEFGHAVSAGSMDLRDNRVFPRSFSLPSILQACTPAAFSSPPFAHYRYSPRDLGHLPSSSDAIKEPMHSKRRTQSSAAGLLLGETTRKTVKAARSAATNCSAASPSARHDTVIQMARCSGTLGYTSRHSFAPPY